MEGKREGIEREGWNGSRGKKEKDEMWTGKLRPLFLKFQDPPLTNYLQ